MEIKLLRTDFTPKTCIANLTINNGPRFCFMLNDRDRGLDEAMSLSEIQARKVKWETAHTAGRHQLVMAWSANFGRNVPHLLNVKGFDLIEFHPGNDCDDTHACDLFGYDKYVDRVGRSRDAFKDFLNATFNKIPHSEQIWVTTLREPIAWSSFIKKYPLPTFP